MDLKIYTRFATPPYGGHDEFTNYKEETWLPLTSNRFPLREIDFEKIMNFEMFIDLRFERRDVGNVLNFDNFIYNFISRKVHKACV